MEIKRPIQLTIICATPFLGINSHIYSLIAIFFIINKYPKLLCINEKSKLISSIG